MGKRGEECCSSTFLCVVGTLNGGLHAVLTLGVTGSRRVISPPLPHHFCPPQKVNKPF